MSVNVFSSQQAALREALGLVLVGQPIVKGALVITTEQRQEVGKIMMGWYAEKRWSIREGTRAYYNPLNYITGSQPTCLIESWTIAKSKDKKEPTGHNVPAPSQDKIAQVKAALDAGLISPEQAQSAAMKILGL